MRNSTRSDTRPYCITTCGASSFPSPAKTPDRPWPLMVDVRPTRKPLQNADGNLMRNLFFDLDGTIADSRDGIINCIKYAFRKVGEAIPEPDELADCLGPPLWESFSKLLSDPTEQRIDSAIAAYRERFAEVGILENHLYPGVVETLSELVRRGYLLFVVTSKPRKYASKIIDNFGIGSLFQRIHGPELDDLLSTKADLIATVLESDRIIPSAAIMIGDRKHDIVGARSNGVACIGVCWGYGSTAELRTAGADLLIDSPGDLLNLDLSRHEKPLSK